MPNLTDTLIRSARPALAPYKLPREFGLFVLVTPTGGKLWRFSYRFGGKEQSLSFGSYPAVTLRQARERRDQSRRLIADGIDPSAQRKADKSRQALEAVNTFEAAAKTWLRTRRATAAPATYAKLEWLIGHACRHLGPMTLRSINPPDVMDALRPFERAGKLETMHRVKICISQVYRHAITDGRAVSDPCRDLRGTLPNARTRHLSALTDPAEVGGLMRAIEGYSGTFVVRGALRLAPLVFVRPGELRTAQWPQFDLDSPSPSWRFHVSKTGVDHIVPLSEQAVAILREIHAFTGHGVAGRADLPRYVFPSVRSRVRPMCENAVNAALRSLGYTGAQMTGHGFRATARTLLSELGWKPDAIERQLAHTASGPLGAAYDRAQYLQERRQMMQAWADYLDGLKRGTVVQGAFGRAA